MSNWQGHTCTSVASEAFAQN